MNDSPCVILSGGQSLRMGREKAFVDLAGRPMIAHVIARLAPQCTALAINAGGDATRFDRFGLPVLSDRPDAAGHGPLSGVLAAMLWARETGAARVLTCPVDTPFVPRDLAHRLREETAPIALAATPDGVHGTVGLWDVALAPRLADALADGRRKVTDWAGSQGAVNVPFTAQDPPPFFNVNTPGDLAQAERWVAGALG